MELNTTLLRERFTLADPDSNTGVPLVASSNRLSLQIPYGDGAAETFVIRAHTMHGCIRMAAAILQTALRMGPILVRSVPFDFAEAWERICSAHELAFNPQRWVAVFSKGKIVYEAGDHHALLDVIEKCDSINPGNYDHAVTIAEDTFRKMGKDLSITHQSNIGLVVNVKPDIGRCGLILRNPHKGTTFNFVVEPQNGEESMPPVLCLSVSAAFLEGIQLAVRIGMANEKLQAGLIENFSPEMKEAKSALRRMAELNLQVREFENRFNVRYRPEKPEFSTIVREAESFQRKLNGPPL